MKIQSNSTFNFTFIVTLFLVFNVSTSLNDTSAKFTKHPNEEGENLPKSDVDLIEFPLNLEYLEAEFFLWASAGRGLDAFAPELTMGGPPPIGVRKAFLDPYINDVAYQIGLQEIGHLRAIKKTVKGFPRPLLDLSCFNFAKVMNSAFERPLYPPFDPYANSNNFLLAAYLIPYVGLTGYVGASSKLESPEVKKLAAGLLSVEAGQDAIIRSILYERRFWRVFPYGITVLEFTNRISILRNKLGKAGIKDEGLVVIPSEGAEGKTPGNILSADDHSLGYARQPDEILRILYETGDEKSEGGFFPKGADGAIATSYLKQ